LRAYDSHRSALFVSNFPIRGFYFINILPFPFLLLIVIEKGLYIIVVLQLVILTTESLRLFQPFQLLF